MLNELYAHRNISLKIARNQLSEPAACSLKEKKKKKKNEKVKITENAFCK